MKILLVTLEYPPTIGGVSVYLSELYRHFPGTVRVVSPQTHRMMHRFFYPHWLPFYFELKKIVALEKPDEIHVSHVLPIGRMARWILRTQKIPYRVILHGTDLQAAHAQPRKWHTVLGILKDAKSCIVNSEATQKLFQKLCGDKIPAPAVITPGVSVPVAQAALAEELVTAQHLSGQRIILFVGRLVPRKGLLVAIHALELLLKIPVAAKLVVIGEGPDRPLAEALAQQLHIPDHVLFLGAISDAEKWAWFRVASLFWFPAQEVAREFEGYGITSIEAQASGCPVVVSRVQGLPETVVPGVSGYIVEPTAEAFAAQSERLLQDAATWQQIHQGARLTAAAHTWDASRAIFWKLLGLTADL